jgi:hypothetical protein
MKIKKKWIKWAWVGLLIIGSLLTMGFADAGLVDLAITAGHNENSRISFEPYLAALELVERDASVVASSARGHENSLILFQQDLEYAR